MINNILKNVIDFYKWFNNKQLLKTREQHHILVGICLTFAICLNLFIIPENFKIYILWIVLVRMLDIHIHNMNVAFFDYYQFIDNLWHPIQHIGSYKRIFILNILVLIELILYIKVIHNLYIIIAFILAVIPTLILFIRCFDYKLEQYFNARKEN